MNVRIVCIVSALALLPLAQAADKKEESRYLAKPLKGDYYVYGGSIGDSTPRRRKKTGNCHSCSPDLSRKIYSTILARTQTTLAVPAVITGHGAGATLAASGQRKTGTVAISASTYPPGRAA